MPISGAREKLFCLISAARLLVRSGHVLDELSGIAEISICEMVEIRRRYTSLTEVPCLVEGVPQITRVLHVGPRTFA